MNSRRTDHLGNLTRRAWLGLAAAGVGLGPMAFAGRAAQDEKKAPRKGQIIAMVGRLGGNKEVTGFIGIDPDDGTWQLLVAQRAVGGGRLSPDGKRLVYSDYETGKPLLWTADLGGDAPPHKISDFAGGPMSWSPDGKQIIVSRPKVGADGRREAGVWETQRMDADGSHATELPLLKDRAVVDWSTDGQWLLTRIVKTSPEGKTRHQAALIRPDGGGQRVVYDGEDWLGGIQLSPDGRELVYTLAKPSDQANQRIFRGFSVCVARSDGEVLRRIPVEDGFAQRPHWSPDGKRVVMDLLPYTKAENGDLVPVLGIGSLKPHVVIMDTDGKNRRELELPEGRVDVIDWR